MPKQYKLVSQQAEQTDDTKQIEIIEMVEQKRTINIAQLKNEVEIIDKQIIAMQARKTQLKAEIQEVKTALNLQ